MKLVKRSDNTSYHWEWITPKFPRWSLICNAASPLIISLVGYRPWHVDLYKRLVLGSPHRGFRHRAQFVDQDAMLLFIPTALDWIEGVSQEREVNDVQSSWAVFLTSTQQKLRGMDVVVRTWPVTQGEEAG